jgi:hypothetical protein
MSQSDCTQPKRKSEHLTVAERKIIERMLRQMASPQAAAKCYGYGLWMEEMAGRNIPHFEGCEEGISFLSTYDEADDLLITLISNKGDNVWTLNRDILREFYGEITPHFDFGE